MAIIGANTNRNKEVYLPKAAKERTCMRRDVLFWSIFAVFVASIGLAAELLDAEKEVVKSRQAITSASLTMNHASTVMNENIAKHEEIIYHLWFSGSRFRKDVLYPKPKPELQGAVRNIECFVDDKFLRWTDSRTEGAKVAFEIQPLNHNSSGIEVYPFDPRFIGIASWHLCDTPYCKFEQLFAWPGRRDVTERDILWNGAKAKEITIDRTDDTMREVIVPEQGYGLVFLGVASKDKSSLSDSLTTEYVRHDTPIGVVWFPSKSTWRHEIGGKLIEERVITVSEVKLNGNIPDSVFAIAGMNVPSGTVVFDSSTSAGMVQKYWDGTEIKTGETPHGRTTGSLWTFYFVRSLGLVLFVAALVMVWRMMGKGSR